VSNTRREFLKTTAAATAAAGLLPTNLFAKQAAPDVAIILEPKETPAPVAWAAGELCAALQSRGLTAKIFEHLDQAPANFVCVLAASAGSNRGRRTLESAGLSLPDAPEAVGLARGKVGGRRVLLVGGSDTRGSVYGLLELTDRVNFAVDPLAGLDDVGRTIERPANSVRSLNRCFVSEIEDKPWFNDREMWPRYLTMLATQRFNRFNLGFGIGYDFLQNVTDGYFLFAYPFLLSVPGYDVRVPELPEAERDRNLEMLKFISEQAAARGLQFQLGIWTHGYQWLNSPNPNYTIAGLTPENHGAYCRDAMCALLKACPAVSGVTLRVHGESGVAEGNYDFWKMVFDGVAGCGRPIEIDMHAKGMNQTMIDLALASGLPVKISPKFWAEHLGMSYHQAEIRELERPKPGRDAGGLMSLSSGSRSFLRYGYGDLLKESRPYTVMHRIWPGTQRLLLWGDPLTGAAYGRAFGFCGSDGAELMEPLTFKGRRGSGIAGDRCAYAEASLKPRWDWEKYLYTLRIWGRLLYNPDADPDVWQRTLRKPFGNGAKSVELALANASRILPIITTAHAPSAANNTYWPEMYSNQSMLDPRLGQSYGDTPAPRVFGNVSPLDPQLFLRINDFAGDLLKGERSGKYSPVEVAQWLEDYAAAASGLLDAAENQMGNNNSPEWRRMVVDVKIQIGLGRFFGAKFRSGVLYGLYEQSGDRTALAGSLAAYRRARHEWAGLAEQAHGIYQPDVTVGELPQLRGHWLDRLPAIDQDIAAMEKKLAETDGSPDPKPHIKSCIREVLARPQRVNIAARHVPPAAFRAGQPLEIDLTLPKSPHDVRLYYRHVNQAERFKTAIMQSDGKHFRAVIPPEYTGSPYPIQYYFEIRPAPGTASLHPGFAPDLANQPYFVVRQS
jgi:hypothetical protein